LIALIVVILSYALSTLVFFLKNKRVNAGLASLAILAYLALPFAGRIFENYIDIPLFGEYRLRAEQPESAILLHYSSCHRCLFLLFRAIYGGEI